jgi:endonuclease/exonuclease/phosphatase family metal-dependent hydrolase
VCSPARSRQFLYSLIVAVLAGWAAAGSAQTLPTLRVMQWNIHNARGSDGLCNPDRTANAIVAQNPHVVSLNEVKAFAGECSWTFDMSQHLQSLLQSKTGVTWYRTYVLMSNKAGNTLLSRYPLASSSTTLLSFDRGVARIAISVNGLQVNLFSTHVEYENASWRTTQITEAMQWMSSFAEPRIVMGDFNTTPGTSDYSRIATAYRDSWVTAQGTGTATAYNGSGATHGNSRFDYVFYSSVAAVSLLSVNVPDTRVNGVFASDHDPVVAVFTLNGPTPVQSPNGLRLIR